VRDWTYMVQEQGVLALSEEISNEFYVIKGKTYLE
jgi:hypothetical protein